MAYVRRLFVALSLVALVTSAAMAADEKGKPAQKKGDAANGKGILAVVQNFNKILPPGADEKLKLTDDQKKEVAKLQDEFSSKTRDAIGKAREALQKARQDKDKGDRQAVMQQFRDVFKTRSEYQDKVEKLLTDDQKKTFEELKKEQSFGKLGNRLGAGKPGARKPGAKKTALKVAPKGGKKPEAKKKPGAKKKGGKKKKKNA